MKKILPFFLLALFIFSCNNDDDITGLPDPVNPDPDVIIPTNLNEDVLGRVPCTDGAVGIYPCNGYDLMSRFSLATLGVTGNNDLWGWTDPLDGGEYAILGTRQGTLFINITNAENPIILGLLPSATEDSIWRDMKVFNNHAFIVSEAPNHGMQVFDLTRLRGLEASTEPFTADAIYSEFTNAHNIVINEDTGFAYVVGSNTFGGGPHFVNIQNPLNPVFSGGYSLSDYTHDAQVVLYNGPDIDHQGQEIFIGSNENEIVIVNVTDKSNPILISNTVYPDIGYTHQGWLSEDQRYFYANDELDESNFGFESRTLIFDFEDLDNPVFTGPFFGPNQAIDHNLYVNGNELYLSNYTAGLRVANISNPTTPVDTGFFDTFPENDNTSFNGVWSIYPYFPSGNVAVSDVNNGFFVIRKSGT